MSEKEKIKIITDDGYEVEAEIITKKKIPVDIKREELRNRFAVAIMQGYISRMPQYDRDKDDIPGLLDGIDEDDFIDEVWDLADKFIKAKPK